MKALYKKSKPREIDTRGLNQLIKKNENLIIIDVRNRDEFNTGHIPNSINIPVENIINNSYYLSKYQNSAIVVYCKSGVRSSEAANYLSKLGFRHIYKLRGGINHYNGKLIK
jgi:rhodanese-related sulfurtransferase